MLLFLFSYFAFTYQPNYFCFLTEENTYGLPNEICLKQALWSKKNDGSSVVILHGPEIQAMMEEVLPSSKKATVTTPFINRFEQCGTNIRSELFLENLDRNKNIDLTKVYVRVHVRYTEEKCDVKWKTSSIHYKLQK